MPDDSKRTTAEDIIGNLMRLLVNVEGWVSHGQSETALTALRSAQHNGWTEMGWRPYLDARQTAKEEARDGC